MARGFVGAEAGFTGDGGTRFSAGVEVGYDTAEALTAEALVNLTQPF